MQEAIVSVTQLSDSLSLTSNLTPKGRALVVDLDCSQSWTFTVVSYFSVNSLVVIYWVIGVLSWARPITIICHEEATPDY